MPRPSGGSRQSNGVGKIYVKFEANESAAKALRAMAGRKFADRTVVTTFFSEVSCFHFLLYRSRCPVHGWVREAGEREMRQFGLLTTDCRRTSMSMLGKGHEEIPGAGVYFYAR